MPTAAVAATAVETAATAAVESTTAVVSAANEAAGYATPVAVAAASVGSTAAIISTVPVVTVAIVAAATIEASAVVAAVEPWAGADEHAAGEVIRTVVAVWGAGVRIIAVVTVSAGGRWPDGAVHGTYSHGHANLRVGVPGRKKQNS